MTKCDLCHRTIDAHRLRADGLAFCVRKSYELEEQLRRISRTIPPAGVASPAFTKTEVLERLEYVSTPAGDVDRFRTTAVPDVEALALF